MDAVESRQVLQLGVDWRDKLRALATDWPEFRVVVT